MFGIINCVNIKVHPIDIHFYVILAHEENNFTSKHKYAFIVQSINYYIKMLHSKRVIMITMSNLTLVNM